ncbi:MAG: hypothetical protein AB8F78_17700 [Saprospiraceae bacterium]
MKLRIRDNSLRLRITKTELKTFAAEKKVTCTINFPGGEKMEYVLAWSADETYSASFSGNSVFAAVAKTAGQKWLQESEVSIDHKLAISDGSPFRLLVEKDFQCLSERKEEDESDMFVNPNTHC